MMIVWPEVMYDAAEFRALDEFLTLPPLPQDSLKIDLTKNCHVPTIPKNRFRVISSTLHTCSENTTKYFCETRAQVTFRKALDDEKNVIFEFSRDTFFRIQCTK